MSDKIGRIIIYKEPVITKTNLNLIKFEILE